MQERCGEIRFLAPDIALMIVVGAIRLAVSYQRVATSTTKGQDILYTTSLYATLQENVTRSVIIRAFLMRGEKVRGRKGRSHERREAFF
jgi:hypothetical protein